ncbi:GerMN domain-containing protein [Pontibacillus sp. ALD_SL1]|uniref:GerMN domain-containing protein n=1 Tax=Pontibacillus sp. ALD_SL1 TaxID=2777185 RepID=UPI001A97909F|nr:GerMN domain-containing protein [Pontibacillus sp. ALD_SL1]QSS98507.1 GerMN domain-containing protein [Pontibacillus sp. ALD_SL1]
MKRNKYHSNDSIKDLLKSMPDVEDRQSSEDLYRKISAKRNNELQRQSKRKKLATVWGVGVASAAAIILFLFAALPSMQQEQSYDTSSSEESVETSRDQAEARDQTKNEIDRSSESNVKKDESSSPETAEASFHDSMATESSLISRVVTKNENELNAIAAFGDLQGQYVVPVTFSVLKESNTMEQLYNSLEGSFKEDEWGVKGYQFASVSFDINQEEGIVLVNFPVDYDFPESSTQENIFIMSLKVMFGPLDVNTIKLETDGEPGINLGNNTGLEEIDISGEFLYKLYTPQKGPRLFISIPVNQGSTVEEALKELKVDETAFSIEGTIPHSVDIEDVKIDGELLEVNMNGGDNIDDQQVITMIESILMTAKQFGFTQVKFNNLPKDEVGMYDLSQAISVPYSVNPMPLQQSSP